jgi:hypothetical protein
MPLISEVKLQFRFHNSFDAIRAPSLSALNFAHSLDPPKKGCYVSLTDSAGRIFGPLRQLLNRSR